MTRIQLYALCVLLLISSQASLAQRFIPTEEQYFPFLLNGWDPKRQTVVIFKDPYCPHCIKAIPKLPELRNYNVYLFWAPILCERSKKRVDDIFRCTAPASAKVLYAVRNRANPECNNAYANDLRDLNDKMVNNYSINSVPSFFLQGQRLSFGQLKRMQDKRPAINGVVVNWRRYQMMQYLPRHQSKSLSLMVPKGYEKGVADWLVKLRPEFVFMSDSDSLDMVGLGNCKISGQCSEDDKKGYQRRINEFKLMFGNSVELSKPVIVDSQGNVVILPIEDSNTKDTAP
jgi:glutaredoxin